MGKYLSRLIQEERSKVNQEEIARKVGLSPGSIHKAETGYTQHTIEFYEKFASYFKIPVLKLIALDQDYGPEAWGDITSLPEDERKILEDFQFLKRVDPTKQAVKQILDFFKFTLLGFKEKDVESRPADDEFSGITGTRKH
jgi:transcriptional regulator with XRE-family HTH domain